MSNDFLLTVDNVYKSYAMTNGTLNVLNGITLSIGKNECVCLLGYSGCGKSTLLRVIAQLDRLDKGAIYLEGRKLTCPTKDVLLLFQDFNQLFPWLTVEKNVMFPSLKTNMYASKKEVQKIAEELLQRMGLSDFKNSYPHQLSGGMKQRVAIARILSLQPKVLLMDEPFAALDATTRTHLQTLTKQICAEHSVSTVFVTHNVEEAIIMGNRIVIMNSKTGTIETIIENQNNHTKDSRTALIAEIIEILNNQLVD